MAAALQTRDVNSQMEPASKRVRGPEVSLAVLKQLSAMQSGLNELISSGWKEKRSAEDWAHAITLEAAEALDSYPWKWWKNIKAAADLKNVKIELVDILHFSLSGQMQVGGDGGIASDAAVCTPLADKDNAIKTFRRIIFLTYSSSFTSITKMVVEAAADLDFNLPAYYVAKHTLNYIRQLQGYKSGGYKKVIDGVEDNELLHQCIEGVTLEAVMTDFPAVSQTIMTKVYDTFQVSAADRKTLADWQA